MSEKKYRIKIRINNVKVNYRIPKNRFKKKKKEKEKMIGKSKTGRALAWYRGGPGFKLRQGRESAFQHLNSKNKPDL